MKKLVTIALLVLLTSGALAACGGSSDSGSTDSSLPTTLNFEGQDILYDVKEASVKTGEEITVNFSNAGSLEHSWVLVGPDVDALLATESDALAGANSGVVPAGESTTFTFFAPPPGDYQIVCTVPGHAAAGMVASLTVAP